MAKTGKRLKREKKPWSPNPYIFGALRRVFRWSPERKAALTSAQLAPDLYKCANCSASFPRKDIAVDHLSPVVDPQRGFQGWDLYANRLFCNRSGLQVLCKVCHSAKSKAENAERRKVKSANKL